MKRIKLAPSNLLKVGKDGKCLAVLPLKEQPVMKGNDYGDWEPLDSTKGEWFRMRLLDGRLVNDYDVHVDLLVEDEVVPEGTTLNMHVTGIRIAHFEDLSIEDIVLFGADAELPGACKEAESMSEETAEMLDNMTRKERDNWFQSRARASYIGWDGWKDRVLHNMRVIWDELAVSSGNLDHVVAKNPVCMLVYLEATKPFLEVK